jgi:dTDP-4-amino-4,6-dideoxygalactose transaminase
MGQKVREFEEAFAQFAGSPHAIAVNSCTAALHLALEAAGVHAGDEVITTPLTFASTVGVIEHLSARPVFADCDPRTLTISPAAIQQCISPRTKAIVPVHYAGHACDMDPILQLASSHGLCVIEDAAHALPTLYKGRLVGNIGDLTCFSFYVTKNITTGEGGMITTANNEYAERARLMRLHGMTKDAWKRYSKNGSWSYDILAPGYKYNLTDIAASIGIHQLKKCHLFHQRRHTIAAMYTQGLRDLSQLETPHVPEEGQHAWHLYVILLNLEALTIDREAFIRHLTALNIGISVHFIPLHIQPYYRQRYGYKPDDFPNAFSSYERLISLPIYPRMTDADVEYVIECVRHIARRYAR